MKKKTKTRLSSFLALSIFSLFLVRLTAPNSPQSFEAWHRMRIEKTNVSSSPNNTEPLLTREYPPSIAPYHPEGIIYVDRIIRNVNYPEPLDLDLVLRVVRDGDLPPPAQQNDTVFSTVEIINGSLSRDDLQDIDLCCLEVFHGKLYAGSSAADAYENSDGTHGTNDTYRRWLYVSESVESGEGISRTFEVPSLQRAVLTIEGIIAGTPHLPAQNPLTKPTKIQVQVRSADSEAGLAGAAFTGPDATINTSFELLAEATQVNHNLTFPAGHTWIQYKVIMSTTDGRVTPVLQKVELTAEGQTLVSDDDWSGGQLIEVNNLFTEHSPGEAVLANRKLADGKTSVIRVIQPPCIEPPQWCYDIPGTGRAFSRSNWPYQAVGDLEPYKGNLYLLVGPTVSYHTGCKAGDFVCYDFSSGLFKVEAQNYFGGNKIDNGENYAVADLRLWGEGAG